jgi:coenzyme F420-reducing hydrogenase delta subunit
MAESEPTILAICCTHCAYNAADLAGSLRVQYPSAVKVMEVPCTGRVDVVHLLRAFEEGVDGVMVAGCLLGDCHFVEGNFNARRRVEYARGLLAAVGLQPERLRMVHVSSAMGRQFAEEAEHITAEVRELGPNPLRRTAAEVGSGASAQGVGP